MKLGWFKLAIGVLYMKRFFSKTTFIVAVMFAPLIIATFSDSNYPHYTGISNSVLREADIYEKNILNEDELITVFARGDFFIYPSIGSMASFAEDIVRVEVLSEREEWINIWMPPQNELQDTGEGFQEMYYIHTVHQLKVLEVFRGYAEAGDIIEVMQLGGHIDNIQLINHDKVSFGIGDDLVLFLRNHGIENVPLTLLNPIQSAYRFTPSNADARIRNFNDELERTHEQNNLILTLDDLQRISEGYSNFRNCCPIWSANRGGSTRFARTQLDYNLLNCYIIKI